MASISYIVLSKSIEESIAISIDFTNAIGTSEISNLISMTPLYRDGSSAEADLVLSAKHLSGNVAQCTVSGGKYNYTYIISTLVATTDGQIFEGRGLLTVE